ncbi:sulfotransferase [Catenovulum sediminis]|uniref:Sulfotransferase n=1 Tax=Catenovulum sediminis TaxID=1740262 RepID=A0ABV1RI93_9ALTE
MTSDNHSQAKCNAAIAKAIVAYREGLTKPIRMDSSTCGDDYIEASQSFICKALSEHDFNLYARVRDISRAAAEMVRLGQLSSAKLRFQQARNFVNENNFTEELRLLAESRISQAEAFLFFTDKNFEQVKCNILRSLEYDETLELKFKYDIFHIQRVHLLHLWMRSLIAEEALEAACNLANQLILYVAGKSSSLPIGRIWSKSLAEAMPLKFRLAMIARVFSEVCRIFVHYRRHGASQSELQIQKLLSCWNCWQVDGLHLEHKEIVWWSQLQVALSRQDHIGALDYIVKILADGRGHSLAWYATVLDLTDICIESNLPKTRLFLQQVEADADHMKRLSTELLPADFRRFLATCQPEHRHKSFSKHSQNEKKFMLFNVGLPRTGTSSIMSIFSNYRSATEYMEAESVRTITAYNRGELTRDEFKDFIVARCKDADLEVDTASFNHFFLPVLVEQYTQAIYIMTVRACLPWCNSFIKLLYRWRQSYLEKGIEMPYWMTDYGQLFFGQFSWEPYESEQVLRRMVPEILPAFIRCWSRLNYDILTKLVDQKHLIVQTEQISTAIDKMAHFSGVPIETLTTLSHINRAPEDYDLLLGLDPVALQHLLQENISASMHTFLKRNNISHLAR